MRCVGFFPRDQDTDLRAPKAVPAAPRRGVIAQQPDGRRAALTLSSETSLGRFRLVKSASAPVVAARPRAFAHSESPVPAEIFHVIYSKALNRLFPAEN